MSRRELSGTMQHVLVLIGIVVVAYAFYAFSEIVPDYGHNIGSSVSLRYDWLLAVAWAAVLGFALSLGGRRNSKERAVFALLWIFRVFICLFVGLWYEQNYDFLDAYGFFRESAGDFKDWDMGIGSGTHNVMALCWLHQQVFPGDYHVMKITFAAIGFIGLRFYYAAARSMFPDLVNTKFLLVLGLIPGVAFWSSIVGKDPVMFLAVGIYVFGVCRLIATGGNRWLLVILLGILLGSLIRIWIAPVLISPMLYIAVRGVEDIRKKGFFITIMAAMFIVAMALFLDHFGITSISGTVATANEISRGWAVGGSAQEVEEVDSVGSIGLALPWWMFSFLFRPFPGEIPNAFAALSGCENVVFLVLTCISFSKILIYRMRHAVLAWMVLLLLAYAVVFSVPGYQNLGSAVRWRLPIVPIMAGIIWFAWSWERINGRLVPVPHRALISG